VRSQVEAALDSWSSRDSARDAISKISHDPLSALIAISKSKREPEVRRSRAIALLATFKVASSEHALDRLADDSDPKYRCLALHSIAELKSHSALPVLIRKLDDHAVCMKAVSTDPAEEHKVYVSDEAVRLLEQTT
jgi:HEAT repeat protein